MWLTPCDMPKNPIEQQVSLIQEAVFAVFYIKYIYTLAFLPADGWFVLAYLSLNPKLVMPDIP